MNPLKYFNYNTLLWLVEIFNMLLIDRETVHLMAELVVWATCISDDDARKNAVINISTNYNKTIALNRCFAVPFSMLFLVQQTIHLFMMHLPEQIFIKYCPNIETHNTLNI